MRAFFVGNETFFLDVSNKYPNGRQAIRINDGYNQPVMMLTMNLSHTLLEDGEFIIPIVTEGSQHAQALLQQQVFVDTGKRTTGGQAIWKLALGVVL